MVGLEYVCVWCLKVFFFFWGVVGIYICFVFILVMGDAGGIDFISVCLSFYFWFW